MTVEEKLEEEASVLLAVAGRKTNTPIRNPEHYAVVVRQRLKVNTIREECRRPSLLTVDVLTDDDATAELEAWDLVEFAMSQLENLERKVIELWLAACTYEQIAVAVERSPGTVRNLKSRAVKKLRKILESEKA